MAGLGAGAIWLGGPVFVGLVCVLSGLMVWELTRMLDAGAPFGKAEAAGFTAAVVLAVFTWRFDGAVLIVLTGLVAALLAWRFPKDRTVAGAYLVLILLAGLGLIALRGEYGALWVLWLVALVVGSDVAGYFAGRTFGGPKLWPRVSPKKTWSGTVAGWSVAVAIALAFMPVLGAGAGLIAASVLITMAGQAGDIVESAIKRHAGVKDSSNLIPGHGGVMDRFDALIAAAFVAFALAQLGVLGA
ncbi:MAG: phosphatidate cytidylyltransferase [Alphaproteobacteria bacterium]|nr:phosphatidate cytidylyltransferase [Alphaproteobacteria bacterium]